MPISAMLLTIKPDDREKAIEALNADPRITVGEPQAWRIPVVLDTASVKEDRALVEALGRMPEISCIDVVMVDYSEDEESWNDAIS